MTALMSISRSSGTSFSIDTSASTGSDIILTAGAAGGGLAGQIELNSPVMLADQTPVALTVPAAGDLIAKNVESTGVTYTTRQAGTPHGQARSIVAGTGLSAANTRRITLVQGSGGAVTVTSHPNIAAGANGEIITLFGTSDSNTVTWQDTGSYADSHLELAGNVNATLGLGDTLTLVYITAQGKWFEMGRTNN
jgi:hypothetical protein